jgi:hypothetical protein
LHARLGQQLDPTIVHLVARGIAASQQRRFGDWHGLFQVRLDPFDVLVGLANDVVHRRLEPAIGRHLVANVAARALRDIGGDFRVHLRRRFQAAEVGPEVFENDGTTMERNPVAAGITNDRREIMVAVMGGIGESALATSNRPADALARP